ncbi:MAG: hypothetical protein JO110_02765 [Acetobacteraceae bacterium]|nr:hypothetical protein [Acetobacteraceae bacterium]
MSFWSSEPGGSQGFWRSHHEIRRIGGMLETGVTFREEVLLSCWTQVIQDSDAQLEGSSYEGRIGELAFFAVDNCTVNAWAVAAPRRSAIVVSRGMLTATADALACAMTEKKLLDDAYPRGTTSNEASVSEELAHALIGGFSGPGVRGERINALHELYCRVAQLVVHHEMAHLARRHLKILRQGEGLGVIDEAFQLNSSRFGEEQLRFIEFDADVHAFDMMLVEAGLMGHSPKRLSTAEVGEITFVLAFAAIVLGQLLDRGEATLALQSLRTHPPAVWRAIFATSLLRETLVRETCAAIEGITDRLNEAWTEAEHVAAALRLSPGRWDVGREEVPHAWCLDDYVNMSKRYIAFCINVIDPLEERIALSEEQIAPPREKQNRMRRLIDIARGLIKPLSKAKG